MNDDEKIDGIETFDGQEEMGNTEQVSQKILEILKVFIQLI